MTTRWGPVQVEITVDGGKITAAQAVQVPERQRPRPGDQLLRAADPQPGGRRRAERQHRHGLRRHVHLATATCSRCSRPSTRRTCDAPTAGPRRAWVEQVMGMPVSVHVRAVEPTRPDARGGRGRGRTPTCARSTRCSAPGGRTATCCGCSTASVGWTARPAGAPRSPTLCEEARGAHRTGVQRLAAGRDGADPPSTRPAWSRAGPPPGGGGPRACRGPRLQPQRRRRRRRRRAGRGDTAGDAGRPTAVAPGGSASRTRATGPASPRWSSCPGVPWRRPARPPAAST